MIPACLVGASDHMILVVAEQIMIGGELKN